MNIRHRKLWHRYADWCLLAAEGLIIGVFSGTVICTFRMARDIAAPVIMEWLSGWRENWWVSVIWLTALILASRFLGWLVGKVPLISGSGIPQTELIVRGKLHISRHEWLKILPAKFAGCLVSTLGGLSLGREGPCIQMGAATAALICGLWEKISFSGHIHIAAGAAAGMTAAFGAPVAGIFFVFEEMKTRFTRGGFLMVLCAVTTAELTTRFLFGFNVIFPFRDFSPPHLSQVWLYPATGFVMGVAGVCYNRALLGFKNIEASHSPLSQKWRILPPMITAFLLAIFVPSVLGGGEELVADLPAISQGTENVIKTLALLAALKIAFSLISYTGNVPGGILMPMLCIGALLGALCGELLLLPEIIQPGAKQSFIVYGMVGFFVSMVRVPFTGTALVMEMSGALSCLPGAAIVAFTASWTATLLRCPPVYDSLRAAILIAKKS